MEQVFGFSENLYVNYVFLLENIEKHTCQQLDIPNETDSKNTFEEEIVKYVLDEDANVEVCRYYEYGNCLRGLTCRFKHGELKNNKEAPFLEKYNGKIYMMSLDKYSCIKLQKELELKNIDSINFIYSEIIDYIDELMCDPIANYLCQKLLDLIDKNQRSIVIDKCKNSLINISNSPYGTRSIQKLIEVIDVDVEFSIIREILKDYVVEMIQNLNGNHVIRKCLQCKISPCNNQFIYDSICLNCITVTTNTYGCCIFKDCLEYGTMTQKIQLVDAINSNIIILIQDPFANYTIQYIFELKIDPKICNKFVKAITGQVYSFSKHKFSSNVIEKCIKNGDGDCVKRIMNELLFNPKISINKMKIYSESFIKKKAQQQMLDLLQDKFGNYVIQTCLNESMLKANHEYNLMVELLLPIKYRIKYITYSNKIMSHLET